MHGEIGTEFKTNQSTKIDFRSLYSILWHKKLTIIVITTFFIVLSIGYSLSLPNIYKSTMILAPTTSSGSNLSNLTSKYSNVARMAGISLPSTKEIDKVDMGIEIIKSLDFFKSFASKNNLFFELQASDGWNSQDNTLEINPAIYNTISNKWVYQDQFSVDGKPSIQSAHRDFLNDLEIVIDPKTSFVIISFEHFSPHISKKLLDLLVLEINQKIKAEDIMVASNSIKFLKDEANKNKLTSISTAINKLIEQQIEVIAFANATPEFLLKSLSSPSAPEAKSSPNRPLIVILSIICGLLISLIIILIQYDGKPAKTTNR